MAFASDSTTAPARPLLPALDRRAVSRDGWARAREMAARLGGEIRDHVAEGMRQAWAAAQGLLQADRPAQSRSIDEVGISDVVPSYPGHGGVVPPLSRLPAPLPSLSAALSRRRAIFGALAVAAVPAVAVPAAAAPSTAPIISSEAKALQDELARLSSAFRRACREADAAADLVEYPDPPEALYARPGDRGMFMRQPEPSWSDRAEGRNWWADPRTVEHLRDDAFRRLDGVGCPVARARRDEILAAIARWNAEDQAAEDAAGYTAAQECFDAASLAYRGFRARLFEMRTDDPEVLVVKGMAIVDLCGRDAGRLDTLIERSAEREGGAHDTALALSMARDFIALFGRSVWVAA